MAYIVAIIVGYLLGCSNMALLLSRIKGVDLRAGGSGNLGTCNALMLMNWKCAILVCAHDMGKAALAVVLMRWLFPDTQMIGYVAGVACVLGHVFPFYLKFKGGKGYASYLGMMCAMNWRIAILFLLAVVVITLISDYIVVATVSTVVAYPIYVGFSTANWLPALILCMATTVILCKHHANYVRIWKGTETRVRKVITGMGSTME